MPPSLQNIYQELANDLGLKIPHTGYLKKWTDQGVLLLNAVLTVRAGIANSHRGMGWEYFTDHIITLLNERQKPVVFLLWGRNAREKKALITNPQHLILEAPHPVRYRPIMVSSDVGIFRRQMRFWNDTA